MRLATLLLLSCLCAQPTELGSPDFIPLADQFNHYFGIFYRDLKGCPVHATYLEECTVATAHPDWESYVKAWRLAQKVFPHNLNLKENQ